MRPARLAVLAAAALAPHGTAQQYIGEGCPGSWGAPPTIRTDRTPTAGTAFRIEVRARAPNTPVSLIFGFSDTIWNTIPLPLDLSPLGFGGCALNVSFDASVNRTTAFSGLMSELIPADALQAGRTFFVQSATVEIAAGYLGFSRGMRIDVRAPDDPFTITMLPDTQHYSDSAINIANFDAQTDWIAQNLATENIVFVSHVGDIVNNGAADPIQWTRAVAAMGRIDGLVPYSAVCGNHDYEVVSDKASGNASYLANFGPQRYAGRSWFVGSSPDGMNMAQRFPAEGRDYLHIGFEWHPPDSAIEWAQSVLAANPKLPTIISTHEHLDLGVPAPWRTGGATPDSSGDNSGDDLFRKLVEPYPQVFLFLCGHVHGDGHHSVSPAIGNVVHEVLADYQTDPNGGNGWMQFVKFRPDTHQIVFDAFSPTYVPGTTLGPDRTDSVDSNFAVTEDLDVLFADLHSHVHLHLRQGQDAGQGTYTGTVDTHVGAGLFGTSLPNVAYGSADNVRSDGDMDLEQGLLRFGNLVGSGPNQVPFGTLVHRAILTLTSEGANAQSAQGAKLHRMLAPWDETSTWDSLGAGVQLGTEARTAFDADASAVANKGTHSFDVTASVQAWVDGETNHGWVLMANGPDRWEFRSSNWASLVERPMLTVVFHR